MSDQHSDKCAAGDAEDDCLRIPHALRLRAANASAVSMTELSLLVAAQVTLACALADRIRPVAELYRSPNLYQRLFGQRVHDVEFYRWLASGEPEVLELGAGTGRVCLPLLQDGVRVVALERAPQMLEVLERRAAGLGVRERLTALQGDFRDFDCGRRFRLVVCPFNGFAHLHQAEELRQALGAVARHLDPQGALVCDVLRLEAHHAANAAHLTPYFEHPDTGVPCRVLETIRFDAETSRVRIELTLTAMRGPEQVEVHSLDLRFWTAEDLALAGEAAGLALGNRTSLGDSDAFVLRRV